MEDGGGSAQTEHVRFRQMKKWREMRTGSRGKGKIEGCWGKERIATRLALSWRGALSFISKEITIVICKD